MSRLALVVLPFAIPLAVFAQTQPQAPKAKISLPKTPPAAVAADSGNTSRLPVKRVVLYKNGIGYFEHTARVHGNQDLGIDFHHGPAQRCAEVADRRRSWPGTHRLGPLQLDCPAG